MAIVFALLGFASIAYGVAVMSLNSGTPFFAVWYALGAAWLAAAWATHAGAWANLPLVAKGVGAACLAAICVVLAVTSVLMIGQFDEQGENGLDYIVVLGAQVRPDETPGSVLQYRLDAAVSYLRENPQTTCIVSGGQGPNEPVAEADCMGTYLELHGIDPARIIREDRSANTVQNIANSMALMSSPFARTGIVTNNFHVFRAVKIAQKAGLENACGISAYSTPFYLPNNMLRETMGIVKDFLAGNL
ncbi:MAG: YdcF family protein [Coriobacteriia bacterium]|nr:YdcF family protein [Coriobacteriia bacterium]